MKLKLRKINFDAGRPVVFIHEYTAKKLDIHVGDRIMLSYGNKKTASIVDTVRGLLKEDEVALSEEVIDYLKVKPKAMIDVSIALDSSLELISKKMNGHELSKSEILRIIEDISNNILTEAEISFFVLGVYEKGMTLNETIYLTEAMCRTGKILKWPSSYHVADKHSIGGIPGNRTTPIVVSICSSAGIIMPKTSSRAITSAAGTADTIETVAKVDFQSSELKRIVEKTGACLAWGGSLGLAPSDDKLIRVERILDLDPESQLLASIISKKLAAGSKYVLIDVPYGPGAKVTRKEASKLKFKFEKIAKHFGLILRVVLTDGSQPIGNGIGPVLEMIDVIKVLKREKDSPLDLEKKSVFLAGELLELTGKAKNGKGIKMALDILNSGKAYKKFEEIISAQGKKKHSLSLAKYSRIIKSPKNGKIIHIDNREINHLARVLGCPVDKSSGVYILKHKNEKVLKNEPLVIFYSESKDKLSDAIRHFNSEQPIKLK